MGSWEPLNKTNRPEFREGTEQEQGGQARQGVAGEGRQELVLLPAMSPIQEACMALELPMLEDSSVVPVRAAGPSQRILLPSWVMQMEPHPMPTRRASTPASMRFLA